MTNVVDYSFEGLFEDWAEDARYFEYSKAANPVGSGHTSSVPITSFGRDLYLDGPTRIIPLDLSTELGVDNGPATSPALVAHFGGSVQVSRLLPIQTPPRRRRGTFHPK